MKWFAFIAVLSMTAIPFAGSQPRQEKGGPSVATLSPEDRQKFEALKALMAGAQRVPVRWRYRVIDLNVSRLKPAQLEAVLDERAGQYGFELVGTTASNERGKTRFLFKAKVASAPSR
ncbi:hypothetical protein [Fimbriimonas ginsengisoli]|uniref:Uncharacterized protein n=1 Tax=Fimbriimonas ginsengisoli Gsoil 348 TaxID=661478 RepID=A0A068NPQ6_FIMGI|nr:hypothetical protein [Fimbriimonas ginsengisoli]AIE85362.1 hypothetical protein OP10G_1994 [Fimbriimonas ginsengisoli Gsoil 348]